jgi:hypothetical protein
MKTNVDFITEYFYRRNFPDYVKDKNYYYYKNDDGYIIVQIYINDLWHEIRYVWFNGVNILNFSNSSEIVNNSCVYKFGNFLFNNQISSEEHSKIENSWNSIIEQRQEKENLELISNSISLEIIPKKSPKQLFEELVSTLIQKDSSCFDLINNKLLIVTRYNCSVYEKFGAYSYICNGYPFIPNDSQFKEFTIKVANSFIDKHKDEDKFFTKLRELLNNKEN